MHCLNVYFLVLDPNVGGHQNYFSIAVFSGADPAFLQVVGSGIIEQISVVTHALVFRILLNGLLDSPEVLPNFQRSFAAVVTILLLLLLVLSVRED